MAIQTDLRCHMDTCVDVLGMVTFFLDDRTTALYVAYSGTSSQRSVYDIFWQTVNARHNTPFILMELTL